MGAPHGTFEERLWKKVNKEGPIPSKCPELGCCWEWMGFRSPQGYGRLRDDSGNTVILHRSVFEIHTGYALNGQDLDHICNNPCCVNPNHLRIATRSQNAYNRKKSSTNTSGFKGVDLARGGNKWQARITVDKSRYQLGTFNTPEEAYQAYCNAAVRLHGNFVNLG